MYGNKLRKRLATNSEVVTNRKRLYCNVKEKIERQPKQPPYPESRGRKEKRKALKTNRLDVWLHCFSQVYPPPCRIKFPSYLRFFISHFPSLLPVIFSPFFPLLPYFFVLLLTSLFPLPLISLFPFLPLSSSTIWGHLDSPSRWEKEKEETKKEKHGIEMAERSLMRGTPRYH